MTPTETQAFNQMRDALEKNHEWHRVWNDYAKGYSQSEICAANIAALAAAKEVQPETEVVKQTPNYITPLMEGQMFNDWCPYKGNPDPRDVWSAAIASVNRLLVGYTHTHKPVSQQLI